LVARSSNLWLEVSSSWHLAACSLLLRSLKIVSNVVVQNEAQRSMMLFLDIVQRCCSYRFYLLNWIILK